MYSHSGELASDDDGYHKRLTNSHLSATSGCTLQGALCGVHLDINTFALTFHNFSLTK